MIRTLAPRSSDGPAQLSAKPLAALAHSFREPRPVSSTPAGQHRSSADVRPFPQIGSPMVRKQSNGRASPASSSRATSPTQRTLVPAGAVARRTNTSSTGVARTSVTSPARAAQRPAPQTAPKRDARPDPTPTPTQIAKPRALPPQTPAPARSAHDAKDHEILHQSWFKSVGPRTYAVQLRKAANGNHALVLIEGKRDEQTNELKKHSLYVWSEDFGAFFKMLQESVGAIKAHPVPDEVKKRRAKYWAKKNDERADADDGTESVVAPARRPRR